MSTQVGNHGAGTHEVNLVPPRISARIARGRASRRVLAGAGLMAALAIGIAAFARWTDTRSQATLAVARASSAPVIALEEEIAELLREARRIESSVELQRSIGVAIPASGLVRAIAQALPAGSVLERIGLEYANVQGSAKKVRRPSKEEESVRELRGEIAGIAMNEADVGRIVDGLAALAPIGQVSLESSRSREFQGSNAREFRIRFTVDLERRWRQPEIASASAATEDKP
jgi:hypothetical protein